jgi:GT2 family glycosyltransferase/glycosyltransferase involved in cell wall biosynthesis
MRWHPVVRRFFWRWRGELLLFGLWCLKPAGFVYPIDRFYRNLLAHMVRRSGLYDESYYSLENPDVVHSEHKPLHHYVAWGDREGRRPMPLFDPDYYREQGPGFTSSVSSLLHYVWVGCHRDLAPSGWFDSAFYLQQNRDVMFSGINPLLHYLRWGALEGRSPSREFDSRFYLNMYPDVAESGINPLVHYVLNGRLEGRSFRPEESCNVADADGEELKASFTDIPEVSLEKILAIQPQSKRAPVVDVIIPVYRNRALTLRCIESALLASNETPSQIVVIDDESPEPELRNDLAALEEHELIHLEVNEENQGFVVSVNRGMGLHLDRDVVILNSDTEVYDGWLDRLRYHALNAPKVASVTPLSNNATICSYPRFLEDNPFALEVSYPELDQCCKKVNAGHAIEAPTGVGFCMYMTRKAIEQIGIFDASAFGRGYGEENDWCQRAKQHGWKNLIAADTFVRHFGSASFQGEQTTRTRQAMRVMEKRHPAYLREVGAFIKADPLASAREKLDCERLKRFSREKNVLMVCHSRGGGAERHVQEDAQTQTALGRGVFFLRPVPGNPAFAYIQHPDCSNLPNLPLVRLSEVKQLAERIAELGISWIHSHGLVDFEPSAADSLHRASEISGVPLHVDIHDYKVICPRINLAKTDGFYCGEPDDEKVCNQCLEAEGNEFGVKDIHAWREQHYRVLKFAEEIYVPDEDVADRLGRYYPSLRFQVMPHEKVEYEPNIRPWLEGENLRIVVIGALSRIKGYDVLLACAKDAKRRNLPLEFILMGYSLSDTALIKAGIEVTGRYEDAQAQANLESLGAHIVFLPAIWPETYSYTLSIALQAGTLVSSFDIGAVGKRLKQCGLEDVLMPLEMARSPRDINRFLLSLLPRESRA